MELVVNNSIELAPANMEELYNKYVLLNAFTKNFTIITDSSSSSFDFTGHSENDN